MLKGHTAGVRAVNFSADGKSLITAGDDKIIKVRLKMLQGGASDFLKEQIAVASIIALIGD